MQPLFAYLKELAKTGFTGGCKTGFTANSRFYGVLRRFYGGFTAVLRARLPFCVRFYGFTPPYRGKTVKPNGASAIGIRSKT
jgi:hypothetical protein